ncbi:hypothetical protein GCM10009715_26540 [Paeniglutamicibacter psychrophenolicus]
MDRRHVALAGCVGKCVSRAGDRPHRCVGTAGAAQMLLVGVQMGNDGINAPTDGHVLPGAIAGRNN